MTIKFVDDLFDNFDWDIVTDTEESELDVNASVLQGFDQYNLANLLPGDS